MKFTELNYHTDKIHYMIHAIFDNNGNEDADIRIEYIRDCHYKVELTDADESYNATVLIDIGNYSAVCKVIPEDGTCDDSYFVFQYQQNIPMHYEIIYCQ